MSIKTENIFSRRAVRRYLIAAALIGLCSCDNKWSSSEISAIVIDAETGLPVKEAIVVANWQITGELEGYPFGQLALFETTTDSQGKFYIPAWSGRRTPGSRFLSGAQPIVRVYRREYLPLIVDNIPPAGGQSIMRANKNIHPWLNGQTLHLAPFHDSLAAYSGAVDPLEFSLHFAVFGPDCAWRKIPKMLFELHKLKAELDKAGVSNSLMYVTDILGPEKCGTGREVLRNTWMGCSPSCGS